MAGPLFEDSMLRAWPINLQNAPVHDPGVRKPPPGLRNSIVLLTGLANSGVFRKGDQDDRVLAKPHPLELPDHLMDLQVAMRSQPLPAIALLQGQPS